MAARHINTDSEHLPYIWTIRSFEDCINPRLVHEQSLYGTFETDSGYLKYFLATAQIKAITPNLSHLSQGIQNIAHLSDKIGVQLAEEQETTEQTKKNLALQKQQEAEKAKTILPATEKLYEVAIQCVLSELDRHSLDLKLR